MFHIKYKYISNILGNEYVVFFSDVMVTKLNCVLDLRVRRGRDWGIRWKEYDHQNGKPGNGTVIKVMDGVAIVKWDNGKSCGCCIGQNGKHALYIA